MELKSAVSAKVISANPSNIEEIVSHILKNQIVVMPYGKKERRVFAIIGLANNEIVDRMKKIKSREASQGVAISGIPDVAPFVAELNQTQALVKSAKQLGLTPQQVVDKAFQIGAVGLILVAQSWLPEGATMINKNGDRTVLIAGEISDEDYDIFPKVYKNLLQKHYKVMVGTSANLHGEDTYHILQQDEALDKLKDYVDVFVYDTTKMGRGPLFKHLTSTTMIDLTGEYPEVIRWGSVHPARFKSIFPHLMFEPHKLKHYQGRERLHHVYIKNFLGSVSKLFGK